MTSGPPPEAQSATAAVDTAAVDGGAPHTGSTRSLSRINSWARHATPVLPPRLALLEIGLLLAVMLAEYLWDGFPAITRFNPHPYWIGVLLLSLQYGTVSGLTAAGIAIIGTVLIGMPEPDIEERYFNYLVRVWTQPVLWLLVALLLGTFRARQIEQRDELLAQADNLRSRGATLLDHAAHLRARCTMLERQLATRRTSDTGSLLAALARLDDAEPGRWATALKTALAAGFPLGQFSLYVIDGHRVRLVLTHGHGPEASPAADIADGHPLLARVVGDGQAASILDPHDDEALRGLGVAAVPIFATGSQGGSDRVIGMLKADLLPPNQIDGATTRRMAVITAHLSTALQAGPVSSVAATEPTALAAHAAHAALTTTGDSVPTVRRWRMPQWLPGVRGHAASGATRKPAEPRDD